MLEFKHLFYIFKSALFHCYSQTFPTLSNICEETESYLSGAKEGKSAASFCHQVAVLVPDMFCNFYLAKNHKIFNNSPPTEAREKISTCLES
jgi:hypothetical protein